MKVTDKQELLQDIVEVFGSVKKREHGEEVEAVN